jgi:sphingolipid delta-4 desaturase
MLQEHPEVRCLIGNNPVTFLCILTLVAVQLLGAFLIREQPVWVGVLCGVAGAVPALGLYFLMHECSHQLVFRSRTLNVLSGILANSANGIPYSVLFTTHHLKHHSSPGDAHADPDLPTDWEARLIGRSSLRKALWLLVNPLFQVLRGSRLSATRSPRGWVALNAVAVLATDVAVLVTLGPTALLYLLSSYFFAMGLPLGAFWIPEHIGTENGQDTRSYYGWLNLLLFNRGYHVEHHDFPSVPWNRLPRLRRLAPEWYDPLHAHRNYFAALAHFVFNPTVSLYSRSDRTPREGGAS